MRVVAVVVFEGINPFHLSVPCTVFGADKLHPQVPLFDVRVCTLKPGKLMTSSGFSLNVDLPLEAAKDADLVIVPGWPDVDIPTPDELLAWLRTLDRSRTLVAGLCLGTFVLAQAGLLDGRRAATHWGWSHQLASRWPAIQVCPDVLYMDEGDILTSAGVAAGMDCCLHILRRWYGAEIANLVARRMVIAPHRQGGQAQFIEQPVAQWPEMDAFGRTLAWAGQNLNQAHTLDSMAARSLMSRSTFTRRFRKTTGTTVGEWLLRQRLVHAQRLLETTSLSLDQVAEQAGFGSLVTMRQHFANRLQISPGKYRQTFRRS